MSAAAPVASIAKPFPGHFAAAAAAAALLIGLVATTPACDSDQYVIINVEGLPPGGGYTVSTYYNLDGKAQNGGAAAVTPPLNQFGIQLSGDARGTLGVTVLAANQPGTCYAYRGQQSLELGGSYRNDITVTLMPASPPVCDFSQVPIGLPPAGSAPLVTWGDSPTNIWVAGAGGTIANANYASRPFAYLHPLVERS